MMIAKQKKAALHKHKLRQNCRWTGDIVEMQCVECQKWKLRTTKYFVAKDGGRNLVSAKAGYESLANNRGDPCKVCCTAKAKIKREARRSLVINTNSETKIQKQERYTREATMLIAKQKKAAAEKHRLKSRCRWKDDIIEMQCMDCQQWKPRTTTYFNAAGGIDLVSEKAGYESLLNNNVHPCKICSNKKAKVKRETCEHTFLRHLAHKYPELELCEVKKLRLDQHGRGPISNIEFICLSSVADWQVNICRKNNDDDHNINNIYLEAAEFNPPQHDVIPCLRTAYKLFVQDAFRGPNYENKKQSVNLYTEHLREALKTTRQQFAENLLQRPNQNGVTASSVNDRKTYDKQMRNLRLQQIITNLVASHVREDIKKGRLSKSKLTGPSSKVKLREYKKKCRILVQEALVTNPQDSVSLLPLTIENGPRRFSIDRNNNSQSHFGASVDEEPNLHNVRFCCRVWNTPRKMTRRKFLQFLLCQQLCELTPVQRTLAQAEFTALGFLSCSQ